MTRLLSGVLMAAVLATAMPLAASASDNDHGWRHRHHAHCKQVKRVWWSHGHKHVVYKRVCR
jgi:Ni/Co efflux regulator RcnB